MKITKQDLISMGCDPEHVEDWFEVRKAKKKPLTGTALKRMQTEAMKAGLTLHDAVQKCAEEGWIGFKAEYVKGAQNETNQRPGTARPDNSAAGRVRQNVAAGIAAAERQIEEIDRNTETLAANEQSLRLQMDQGIR